MGSFLSSDFKRARSEVLISSVLLFITAAAFILFFVQNYLNVRGVLLKFTSDSATERAVYTTIFAVFMYGSLAYQISRLAFFWNLRRRTRAESRSLRQFLRRERARLPHLEILVPCYQEESHVIWQTLMSAALVDYPQRGVVLLLDDPPISPSARERDLLLSGRAQVEVIRDLLDPMAARFATVTGEIQAQMREDAQLRTAAGKAADLYDEAADFLEQLARQVASGSHGGPDDHTRKFFIARILLNPARTHRRRAEKLRKRNPSRRVLAHALARLADMFAAKLSVFERKRFNNLSHAANKAANLNSYLSIMGRRLKLVSGANGLELVEMREADSNDSAAETIEPRDSEYIIILDADSFLMPEYAMSMISSLESPENARAAVAQTPYTAIPGTPHLVERVAGATTDIYYYVTEGMGFLGAGFWVGASATIRKLALRDIEHTVYERGQKFPAYIQDKTVIEDTGATIDLVRCGWRIHNYPARLSFSATPADFGALVVQRRRWANGGLVLLPALFGYVMSARKSARGLIEALLRIHYLIMPAFISASMVAMLIYPFDFKRVSAWIYLTIPPYLYLVCRDLVKAGYRRRDLIGAYALYLLLLPVVLSGVLNSLGQILTGAKARFARTPKIEHRTAVPLTFIAIIVGLFGWSATSFYADFMRGNGIHAFFGIINALALSYGIGALIGVRAIIQDVNLAIYDMFATALWSVRYAFGMRDEVKTVQDMPIPYTVGSNVSTSIPQGVVVMGTYGARRTRREIGRLMRKHQAVRRTGVKGHNQRSG